MVDDLLEQAKRTRAYQRALSELEMESRNFRKRRLPYLDTLNQHASEKASDIVASLRASVEISDQTSHALTSSIIADLVKECRDGL